MIKAIIFDLGGVIVLNKSEDVYRGLAIKLGIDPHSFLGLQKKYRKEMLTGRISADDFVNIVRDTYKIENDIIRKWRETYHEVMPVNYELINLTENLKKKYKVAMVSNAPALHAQINKERGVFSHFEPAIISCDVGFDKSNKRIYELVLDKLLLKAEECIVIDDRERFLEIPKQMGFATIHYKDNKQFINELRKTNIEF